MQTTERLLYPRKDAAFQLGVSVRTLDYLIARKELETRRIGKKVLVTRRSLVRFAGANHFGAVSSQVSGGEGAGRTH
jgi:excisionase family DNA binding protein